MHLRKNFEIFGKEITVKISEKRGSAYIAEYCGRTAYVLGAQADGSFTGKVMAVIDRGGEEIPVAVPSAEYGKDICFECNIREAMGSLLSESDKLYQKFEKTCGAVMFTEKDGERRYMLIKNNSGHIGFPKGHIEYGESEYETAKREVLEETGLEFVPYGDFRTEYTYHTLEDNIKTGVFFLSHYDYKKPTIQQEEILDDWLLPYEKAIVLLNFPQDREVLEAAENYIIKER